MRRKVKNRNIVEPDIAYNSQKLGKFINNIMIHGKKETARKAVYKAFDIIFYSFKLRNNIVRNYFCNLQHETQVISDPTTNLQLVVDHQKQQIYHGV